MKLRYTMEPYHTKAFTVTNEIDLPSEAEDKITQHKRINNKLKYQRFSNWILYDNFNKVIKKYT